jgi:hypothetical protein
MESMLYRGHRFLRGREHFGWQCVEHEPRSGRPCTLKRKKMWTKWGLSWVLIDVWQSEWLVVSWIWPNHPRHFDRGIGYADTWMLNHDYSSCHTPIFVNEVLTKKGIPVVPKPPYSPDLSPCDLFLFPKLEFHLKGCHFGNVDNIQMVVAEQLRALPHKDFQHCCWEWEQRLRLCVASKGNYFEGDDVDF